MTSKRKFSTYSVQRRATRRAQDKDDDAFYAEQARKRREAEAKEAETAPVPDQEENREHRE
jgi:hypothetical protein